MVKKINPAVNVPNLFGKQRKRINIETLAARRTFLFQSLICIKFKTGIYVCWTG
jgi:hypothetical protein